MSFQVISLFIKLPKWKHLVRHIYTNLAPWQNDQTFSYGTQELAKGGNSELKKKFSIHFQIIPLHTNFCFFRFILLSAICTNINKRYQYVRNTSKFSPWKNKLITHLHVLWKIPMFLLFISRQYLERESLKWGVKYCQHSNILKVWSSPI